MLLSASPTSRRFLFGSQLFTSFYTTKNERHLGSQGTTDDKSITPSSTLSGHLTSANRGVGLNSWRDGGNRVGFNLAPTVLDIMEIGATFLNDMEIGATGGDSRFAVTGLSRQGPKASSSRQATKQPVSALQAASADTAWPLEEGDGGLLLDGEEEDLPNPSHGNDGMAEKWGGGKDVFNVFDVIDVPAAHRHGANGDDTSRLRQTQNEEIINSSTSTTKNRIDEGDGGGMEMERIVSLGDGAAGGEETSTRVEAAWRELEGA